MLPHSEVAWHCFFGGGEGMANSAGDGSNVTRTQLNSKVKWPPTGGLKGHKLNHRINTFRYIFSTASGSKSTVSFHVSKTMQRSDSSAVAAVIENKVFADPTSLKSCPKTTRTSRVQQKGPLSWGLCQIVSTSLLSSNLSNLPPNPGPFPS